MTRNRYCLVSVVGLLIGWTTFIECVPTYAQETAVVGTVSSTTKNTMTISTAPGQYQLYTFTVNAVKPALLPIGTQVQVLSSPGDEPDIRIARMVSIVQPGAPAGMALVDIVPEGVHRLEREVEKELRPVQIAARTGIAIDPELVLIGADAKFRLWNTGLHFRPGVELGIGELTTMVGFNLEGIYRLPLTGPTGRWTTYVGGGVGINLIHLGFEGEENGSRFDFGDFTTDGALNIVGGIKRRNGLFMELRTSIYSRPSPTMRLMIGYTF